jgi:uncharacterized membrane protein YedE/YeeE
MVVDVEHYTPLRAVLGGALIGLSASWFFLAHARIAGISGLLGQLVGSVVNSASTTAAQLPLTVAFLVGLAVAPLSFIALGQPVAVHLDAELGSLIAGGLFVGLGTRYAGGCTSGHGVCGLSALSPRSLVATLLFMAAAFVTVAISRWLA